MNKFHFTYISSIQRAFITWQIFLLTEYVQMFQRALFPDLSYYKCTFNPCSNPVRVVVASACCGKVTEDQKSQQLFSGEQQLEPFQLRVLVFYLKTIIKWQKKILFKSLKKQALANFGFSPPFVSIFENIK